MRCVTWIQVIAILLLVVSVALLGVELFIRDADNTNAILVWGIIAIVCLNINAIAAIYKYWKSGNNNAKALSIFLLIIILIFWISKAVKI